MSHPLLEYIVQVKRIFELRCPNENGNYDFQYWLTKLDLQVESEAELAKVFAPLAVTCYKSYALFKYRNMIELDDMGYGPELFYMYDGLYQECRSCTFDLKAEKIVFYALRKFKNYGEDENIWSPDYIRKWYANSSKVYITNKLDGSYQQYRYIPEAKEILGSGSQALDINESWRLQRGFAMLSDNHKKMLKDNPEYTFVFEMISTDNLIVVNYSKEQEGLYLLATRDDEGNEMTFDKLSQMALDYDVPMTEWYKDETIDTLLSKLDAFSSSEKEGWVVDMYVNNHSHLRCKIKVNDYVQIHRYLSKLVTPNGVVATMANNTYDDFYAKVPAGYKDVVAGYYKNVVQYVQTMNSKIKNYTESITPEIRGDKKQSMLWIDANVPKIFNGYVKAMYLGKPFNLLANNGGSPKRYVEITRALEKLGK